MVHPDISVRWVILFAFQDKTLALGYFPTKSYNFLFYTDSIHISPHTAGNAIVLGAKSVLGSHFWLFFFPSFTVYFYLLYLQNISRIKLFDANLLLSGSRYISCLDYSNSLLTRYILSTLNYSEEKGTAKDEMVGWHHQLNGHGFGWTPGVGDGQGGLACCSSWGHKESDMTERLNWTELTPTPVNF